MPATKPPYPSEFRAEAVRLVRESGKKLQQIAADRGVSEASLRKWVRQAEIDAGQRPGLTTAEREELNRLRRENRILREEREILKKVLHAAYGGTTKDENGVQPKLYVPPVA
ncbi:transposase [Hydrogenibacillus schlegelii]|uniref:Transposase n=1 Tax=Hydrogenibacillus schlegelii TaxID=1484 RepID=A0A132NCN1_HYDSH|nr:transposase [Hydrogenibacillus schlegelii]KWX07843.1 transposase [Hydrogenibacillus schlegelii]OAR03973.1 transposase [Hydrogenibacillus schlegelii]